MEQVGPISSMFNEGSSRELQEMGIDVSQNPPNQPIPPPEGQQPPMQQQMDPNMLNQQQQFDPNQPQFDPNQPQFDPNLPQFDPNQPQFDPNVMQGQVVPLNEGQVPNAEQYFYNEVMDRFHGFEGGSINGANDVDVHDAMSSFGFNALIFTVLIVSYEIISRLIPSVYASRKLHVSDDRMAIDVPKSCFPCNWVPSVIRASWYTTRKCGGLDAYFFLRFIAMCFRITAVSGFWGVMILWPIFASGGDGAVGWYHYSMANVRSGSVRNWAPAVFMWLMTFYVLHVMNEEYKHYLELRMQYLSEGDIDMNPQTQHSLLIEEIPRELRSDRALFQYFDTLYPGKVHSATVVLNIPDLEKIAAKRKRAVRRLEKSNAYFEATGRRGTHVVGRQRCRCFGIETFPIIGFGGNTTIDDDEFTSPQRGSRVDSISYYKNQLDDLNDKVEFMQQEKRRIMEEGNDRVSASEWIAKIYRLTSDAVRGRSNRRDGLLVGFQDKDAQRTPSVFKQISVDFFFGGLQFLNRNIDTVVESVSRSTLSSTGFVTFTDMATVVAAGKTPHSHDPDLLRVSIAPDPRDIIWENAHVNDTFNKGREWTANVIIGFGAILWSTVVASIQAWATIDKMSSVPGFHWMNTFSVNPAFSNFVNGYLPVVALLVIISILPLIFETVAQKFENRKTKTDVQNSMLGRYFYYQLANIYVTVTAGSIWTSLSTIVDHPGSIFEILGKSIPNLVGFFVTLLVTKTLAGLPITMLRIVALLRQIALRSIFRQKLLTQRELDEVYKRETLLGGWQYPNILFVVVICFTYACISPIILPFGAIFFLGALVVFKKQVLLVYTPDHESGGAMFPSACKRVLIGLICGQVTLIGYMILRASFYQPLLLLPLPFTTYMMIQSFHRIYQVPSAQLSLERASQLDQKSMVKIRFDEDLYRQPVMAEGRVEPLPYRIAAQSSPMMTSSLGILNTDTGKIV